MANYKNETIYIRIMARPDQVEETAAQIRAALPVTAESPDYPNRITTPGDPRVRRYLKIKPDKGEPT